MGNGLDEETVRAMGLDPNDFFLGEEGAERCDVGMRACMGLPPRNAREAAIRGDIYVRNSRVGDKPNKSEP
jgi:hypothetical protein